MEMMSLDIIDMHKNCVHMDKFLTGNDKYHDHIGEIDYTNELDEFFPWIKQAS
jgi:hypothetical protein